MTTAGGSRRETRYFVLREDGREPEIARLSSRGSSAYFDAESGSWINDPLLGAEIRMTDEWTSVPPTELPDGAVVSRRSVQTGRRRRLLDRLRRMPAPRR